MALMLAAGLLSPNAGLAFWIALTFILLLVALRRFAWRPILGALDARETNIKESIDRAEKALAEARQIQEDNDKARRHAEADAQRLLREARETADRLRSEEVEKTREQVRQLQETAQADIERERDSAIESLRNEVADLVIQAAERVIGDSVDTTRQRKLVDDFLKGMPNN